MTEEERLTAKLIDLLASVDFDRRYYEYCHAHEGRGMMRNPRREDFEQALKLTGLEFKFSGRERIFTYQEVHDTCTVGLTVAFPSSTVEFILTLKRKEGAIGDPFPKLARLVATRRDPSFTPSPRSPKFPFSNAAELQDALRKGEELFQDAKRAILSYQAWNA